MKQLFQLKHDRTPITKPDPLAKLSDNYKHVSALSGCHNNSLLCLTFQRGVTKKLQKLQNVLAASKC